MPYLFIAPAVGFYRLKPLKQSLGKAYTPLAGIVRCIAMTPANSGYFRFPAPPSPSACMTNELDFRKEEEESSLAKRRLEKDI